MQYLSASNENHMYDLALDGNASRDFSFGEIELNTEAAFNCYGTVGTAGTFGSFGGCFGSAGTGGTFGCANCVKPV